jgi:hypothetical protein
LVPASEGGLYFMRVAKSEPANLYSPHFEESPVKSQGPVEVKEGKDGNLIPQTKRPDL